MQRTERRAGCDKFKELCALAQADALDVAERLDLERHLLICAPCREIHDAYAALSRDGLPFLAAIYDPPPEAAGWDGRAARERLLSSLGDLRQRKVLSFTPAPQRRKPGLRFTGARQAWTAGAAAACVTVAVALGAYRLGERKTAAPPRAAPVLRAAQKTVPPAEPASTALLATQAAQISGLEERIAAAQREIARLRSLSGEAQEKLTELGSLNDATEAQLQQRTAERDKLVSQLSQSQDAYQKLKVELTNLQAEHSQSVFRMAALESRIADLTATTRDQDTRLKDDAQFLVSDRDIRELMGARKLYIADVFDVDSGSRTKKPFGRVFYTQNKSLVFYAFDLDHQPGVKNASAFQVWGQRDSESNTESHPMNLGILYMDSESNRRWVLRYDDPKQLAEIDAVFVTVEPHGGSQKPTGKPLLYALLRKEANHP